MILRVDPAVNGPAVLYAYEATKDPFYKEGAERQLDWAPQQGTKN